MKKTLYTMTTLISLLSTSLYAEEKHLLLVEGTSWLPIMPKNLIENHDTIKELPFSGFIMVGNTYTNEVMKSNSKLNYDQVWKEVKGLKNLYENKHNFLQINIHFPGDFWDNNTWEQVKENFSIVAKVAKDLNFKGIVFDDETYRNVDNKMTNFKFPTKDELTKDSASWERKGSEESSTFDKYAYRNSKYTFEEHSNQIISLFKEIMEEMVKVNSELTLLVYHGPALSHHNSNKDNQLIVDLGLPRAHEHLGAIFTGFKQGLSKNAQLYDMGESYRYREDAHFKNSYEWRKHNIAKDAYNDDLNSNYQWVVPHKDRYTWSKDVNVGFMVFNKGQESTLEEFDTRNTSSIEEIGETLKKALEYSDKYTIFYSEEQDWLLPNQKYPLQKGWMEMMEEVYKNK